MRTVVSCFAVVLVVCLAVTTAQATNQVVVTSMTIGANATDVALPIQIVNDFELRTLVAPFAIREVTPGAFISAMRLSWGDRLLPGSGHPLYEVRITNMYPDADGTCGPVGFVTSASNDTLKHAVATSPEGALFVAVGLMANSTLPPGSDATGSLILNLDVTGTAGTFEVDTACTDPAGHLLFSNASGTDVTPQFTKGIVTIVANDPPVAVCSDATVTTEAGCTAPASIDAGSFDPDGDPITVVQTPPGPYPLGATLVRLDVYDINAGHDWCEATVTVVDGTPPIITCPDDIIHLVAVGETGAMIDFTPTATDECGTVSIVSTPPSGSVFPVGISSVTCVATDAAGNTAQCTFHIAVSAEGGYCNQRPEDIDCDGQITALDLQQLIDVLFWGRPASGVCCKGGN